MRWSLRAGQRVDIEPAQLPDLMSNMDWVMVPSIWWENSPLVIGEARTLGRPVICSRIGGMAEKVTEGENGLCFTVGDAHSLTDTLMRAATTPGLWDSLVSRIQAGPWIDDMVDELFRLYEGRMAAKTLLN